MSHSDSNSTPGLVRNILSKLYSITVGLITWQRKIYKNQYLQHGQWRTWKSLIIAFGVFFGIIAVLAMVVILPLDLVGVVDVEEEESLGETALAVFFITGLSIPLYSFWKARGDVKDIKQTHQYVQRPTPSNALQARSYLSSFDDQARFNAVKTIDQACQNAPGKIVKSLSDNTTVLIGEMVELLYDDNSNIRDEAASVIAWFARDYPEAVAPYADTLVEAMTFSGERIKGELAIALGSVANVERDRLEEFADAMEPAVMDEDPEVRNAAAMSLSNLPCERTEAHLERLAEDNHPEVRETAQQVLAELRGQTPTQGEEGRSAGETADAPTFIQEPPDIDFGDIAGMDNLKEKLHANVIDPFQSDSEVYDEFDVKSESGILFHGPPGTGKTYIARCVAGELGANYAEIKVSDIQSKWIGEGVENIGALFEEAKAHAPAVVFIDEIDALAASRSGGNNIHEDQKRMVNQLLQELEAVDADDGVVVIAATNLIQDVDSAIRRPGRFDSKIEIPKPDETDRWAIFEHSLPVEPEQINRREFLRRTSGFSASELVAVSDRATRQAANRKKETGEETHITHDDVMKAIESISDERGQTGEFITDPPESSFVDVIGMDGVKEELRSRIIEPLEHPDQFEKYGISVENGFLLHGPPGTGKTFLAKSLAGELGINFIHVKAGDLVSKFVGEGAKNVQAMFEEARANQPTLIFIDEIDALATDRGANQTKSERQMVNQFLEELTEISDSDDRVIVIAATNRPDDVDDAMLRAGRLGSTIEVYPPESDTLAEMFLAKLEAPCEEVDHAWLARQLEGLVPSDIERLTTNAAREAMTRARDEGGPDAVTKADIASAVDATFKATQAYD